MRALTSLGLKEAKDLVDGAPKPVLEKANKETADKAKAPSRAPARRSPSSSPLLGPAGRLLPRSRWGRPVGVVAAAHPIGSVSDAAATDLPP